VSLFNSDVLVLNYGVWNLAAKTIETSLYRVVPKLFRYIEPFRRRSPVWQTDGRAKLRYQ